MTSRCITLQGTREEWQKVFFISCGFFLFGGLFFLIFAKGEVQPWAITEKPADLRLVDSVIEKKQLNDNEDSKDNRNEYETKVV